MADKQPQGYDPLKPHLVDPSDRLAEVADAIRNLPDVLARSLSQAGIGRSNILRGVPADQDAPDAKGVPEAGAESPSFNSPSLNHYRNLHNLATSAGSVPGFGFLKTFAQKVEHARVNSGEQWGPFFKALWNKREAKAVPGPAEPPPSVLPDDLQLEGDSKDAFFGADYGPMGPTSPPPSGASPPPGPSRPTPALPGATSPPRTRLTADQIAAKDASQDAFFIDADAPLLPAPKATPCQGQGSTSLPGPSLPPEEKILNRDEMNADRQKQGLPGMSDAEWYLLRNEQDKRSRAQNIQPSPGGSGLPGSVGPLPSTQGEPSIPSVADTRGGVNSGSGELKGELAERLVEGIESLVEQGEQKKDQQQKSDGEGVSGPGRQNPATAEAKPTGNPKSALRIEKPHHEHTHDTADVLAKRE